MVTISQFQIQTRIKICMLIIIAGLFLSGITAFPIQTELAFLMRHSHVLPVLLQTWLQTIYIAVSNTNRHYPYLAYGTDWLAFAHLMLAVLFIGPLKEPVKNVWVVQFGMIASVGIFALAFIAGGIRGIPVFWRLIDCSFGILCLIPLGIAYSLIKQLNSQQPKGL